MNKTLATGHPHQGNYRGPTAAHEDQRELNLVRERVHLLNVMIASSRGRLHHQFSHCWVPQPDGKPSPAAIRKEGFRRQGDWVECHKAWDYEWAQLCAGQIPRMSDYRGRSGLWWFTLQQALYNTIPTDYPFPIKTAPMFFAEIWEALVGLPDPAAREAAFRLGGRMRDERGMPIYHQWR